MTTALNIWSQNKVIGTGPGSFRHQCNLEKYKLSLKYKNDSCSTHPHNYYLEILSELGFLGLLFFIIFVFKIISDFFLMYKNNLIKKYFYNHTMIKIFFINFLSFAIEYQNKYLILINIGVNFFLLLLFNKKLSPRRISKIN